LPYDAFLFSQHCCKDAGPIKEKSAAVLSINHMSNVQNIKKDLNTAKDFLCLAKMFDIQPEIKKHPLQQVRSLYQADSEGREIKALESLLEAFFGKPRKPAGQSVSQTLHAHPAVKYLGGIRKEQALYLKKARTGSYYGALAPDPQSNKISIHLGFCHHQLSEKDHQKLENLVKTNLQHERLFDNLDARHHGRIKDFQFGSFLQIAEMLKLTCTVIVQKDDKVGFLFLHNGDLISAETGDLKNKEAAYEIIHWNKTRIRIEDDTGKKKNNINQPLVDILKEALKPRKKKSIETKEAKSEVKNKKSFAKKDPKIDVKRSAAIDHPSPEKSAEPVKGPDKSKRKKKLPFAAMIFGAVFITCVGAVVSLRMINPNKIEDDYQSLLVEIENQTELEQKKILLQNYVDSHDQSENTLDAQRRIAEISDLIEERDLNLTLQNVAMLALDENYEKEAAAIYRAYLEKYPESLYADRVEQKIAEIPEQIEAADYEKLKEIAQADYDQRFAAYTKYLASHPNGRYIHEVQNLISGMGDEYFDHLKQQIPICEQQNQWENCVDLSSQFLKYFENSTNSEEVIALRKQFQDKRDLGRLRAEAENKGGDFEAAKQIYLEYLATHPGSSIRAAIEYELVEIEYQLEDKKIWENAVAFSKDKQNDISTRISYLERYIRKNSSGPYVKPAKKMLKQLQSEKQIIRQREIEEQQKNQQARLQKEKERQKRQAELLQRQKDRILRKRERFRARLGQADGRFVANEDGTVTDAHTGLMWSILDSQQELGDCLNYDSAVAYVEDLETGGYQDWRLPSAGDLAKIYKSKPFFPDSGAKWYWTSETFETGFSWLAGIVTTKKENVFKREFKKTKECGAVRAVRP
jgi:hypothetical protein